MVSLIFLAVLKYFIMVNGELFAVMSLMKMMQLLCVIRQDMAHQYATGLTPVIADMVAFGWMILNVLGQRIHYLNVKVACGVTQIVIIIKIFLWNVLVS